MGTNHRVHVSIGYRFTARELIKRLLKSGALQVVVPLNESSIDDAWLSRPGPSMMLGDDQELFETYELGNRLATLADCRYLMDSSNDLDFNNSEDRSWIHIVFSLKSQAVRLSEVEDVNPQRSTADRLAVDDGFPLSKIDELRPALDGLAERLGRIGLDCSDMEPGIWLTASSG